MSTSQLLPLLRFCQISGDRRYDIMPGLAAAESGGLDFPGQSDPGEEKCMQVFSTLQPPDVELLDYDSWIELWKALITVLSSHKDRQEVETDKVP